MDKREIRERRKRLGLSQEKFGELLGVSRRTVIDWEAGKPVAHEKMLELACKQLEAEQLS